MKTSYAMPTPALPRRQFDPSTVGRQAPIPPSGVELDLLEEQVTEPRSALAQDVGLGLRRDPLDARRAQAGTHPLLVVVEIDLDLLRPCRLTAVATLHRVSTDRGADGSQGDREEHQEGVQGVRRPVLVLGPPHDRPTVEERRGRGAEEQEQDDRSDSEVPAVFRLTSVRVVLAL